MLLDSAVLERMVVLIRHASCKTLKSHIPSLNLGRFLSYVC